MPSGPAPMQPIAFGPANSADSGRATQPVRSATAADAACAAAIGLRWGGLRRADHRGAGCAGAGRRAGGLRRHRPGSAHARRAAGARQPLRLDADLRPGWERAQRGGRSELRPAHRGAAGPDFALPVGRHDCHRGPELLQTPRRGSGRAAARALLRGEGAQPLGAGRQHHHPAVGQAHLPDFGEDRSRARSRRRSWRPS